MTERNDNKTEHPSVIGRRPYHVGITEWEATWSSRLQIAGAIAGFLFVLLPAISRPWRDVVNEWPLLAWMFHEFSKFGPFSMSILGLMLVLTLLMNVMAQHFPGGWNATKHWGFPTAKVIRDQHLYPSTQVEEVVFWAASALGLFGFFLWLFLPFGVIAYFIRIGE